ncbi:Inositol polyphosphate multikinase alpha [Linum perenne]
MFKVPEHQVAGHQAINGLLGPLVDDSGRFYKPLQSNERGATEMTFYKSFSTHENIPQHVRRFFPVFHGTQSIEASDGSGLHPHLILEDVTSTRLHPCVMDIKIGSRTWDPEASLSYIEKCLKKDTDSSSPLLGFRISGLKVYGDGETKEEVVLKPDRKLLQNLTADEVRLLLKRFVSSNPKLDHPDCSFASVVYGGSNGILAQLLELKAWFEDQTIYHFNSCSVLMLYEKTKKKTSDEESSGAVVKLIDFAHVTEGKGVIDHNFLGGLCSLIKFISEILTSPDESSAKSCLEDGLYCSLLAAGFRFCDQIGKLLMSGFVILENLFLVRALKFPDYISGLSSVDCNYPVALQTALFVVLETICCLQFTLTMMRSDSDSSIDSFHSCSSLDPTFLPLPSGEYEVFLSFRGPDVRQTFADHLYSCLVRAKILTFRDEEELRKGETIGPSLIKAITESKIYIPILTQNYASSKWCLQELAKMVDCWKNGGGGKGQHIILPVFYFIDPRDVRHPDSGPYQEAFEQLSLKHDPETILEWKQALQVIGKMKGWHITELNG